MIQADTATRIVLLKGINQDTSRVTGELADCKNVLGSPTGISVWRGRDRFIRATIGPQSALQSVIWPDEHESLVIFGENGLKAWEVGEVQDLLLEGAIGAQEELDKWEAEAASIKAQIIAIMGEDYWIEFSEESNINDLREGSPERILFETYLDAGAQITKYENLVDGGITFTNDPRNPMHFTQFSYGRYIVGSSYRRDQVWYWDGKIDHEAKAVTIPFDFRVVEAWGGRLWGMGALDFPLSVFYGNQDELEIKARQFFNFRDNPKASRILGMRAFNRTYAYVWGDRGVWQLELTGNYPLFANPVLLHNDCDCISNSSIVEIPGVGFAWMGLEHCWLLSGGSVRKIDLSNDERQAERIKTFMESRSLSALYLCRGFYHRQRQTIMWSCPTRGCTKQNPWQEPKTVAWEYLRDSWWLIDQGYQGVDEVVHSGERVNIATDEDGFLYILDHNNYTDKIDTELEWFAEFEWMGDPAVKQKWINATLERKIRGTDKVVCDFYCRQQTDPIQRVFSISEAYDDASLYKFTYTTGGYTAGGTTLNVRDTTGFPDTPYEVTNADGTTQDILGIIRVNENEQRMYSSKTSTTFTLTEGLSNTYTAGTIVEKLDYDPDGPNDAGLPPDPVISIQQPIRLVGQMLKIKIHNLYDGEYLNGPGNPIESLTVLSRKL